MTRAINVAQFVEVRGGAIGVGQAVGFGKTNGVRRVHDAQSTALRDELACQAHQAQSRPVVFVVLGQVFDRHDGEVHGFARRFVRPQVGDEPDQDDRKCRNEKPRQPR